MYELNPKRNRENMPPFNQKNGIAFQCLKTITGDFFSNRDERYTKIYIDTTELEGALLVLPHALTSCICVMVGESIGAPQSASSSLGVVLTILCEKSEFDCQFSFQ